MRFIINREVFASVVSSACRAVRSRTPRPQLACILLSAEKPCLTARATDGEVSLSIRVDSQVDVQKPGAALVPAARLSAVIAAETSLTLTVETTDADGIRISGDNGVSVLHGYAPADFPPSPETPAELAACEAEAFRLRLGQVIPCADTTTTSRYAVSGVLWRFDGKKVEMVATDGKRMAVSTMTAKASKRHGIVPLKAASLMLSLCADAEGNVAFGVSESVSAMRCHTPHAEVTCVSLLIEGTFPPYEKVVPPKAARGYRVNTEQFVASILSIGATVGEGENRAVRIEQNGKGLKLSARVPEIGTAVRNCEGSGVESPAPVAFFRRCLVDAAKAVGSPEMLIEQAGEKRAHAIRGDGVLVVVQPLDIDLYGEVEE